MNFWRLTIKGIRFYWQNHIGVMLCVAISTAVILGALIVGDSVRYSLKKIAMSKIGKINLVLNSQDRFFRDILAKELDKDFVSALLLTGIAINTENKSRANNAQIIGVDDNFWKFGDVEITLDGNSAIINERLAKQLGVKNDDEILIRVKKNSLLPLDAPLSVDTDLSVSLRIVIKNILPDLSIGGFSLQANQIVPFNVFLPIKVLQDKVDLKGKANLILIARSDLTTDQSDKLLKEHWQLADIGLELSQLSELGMSQLSSKRIFIDQPMEDVAREISSDYIGILTYFANEIRHGDLSTPYSMITAIDPRAIKLKDGSVLKDDEIIINQWLADDIKASVGRTIKLSYFVFDNQRRLTERSSEFKIKSIAPIKGIFADKTLMPEFPGLANVENSRDWEPGIPIDLSKIRDKDEDYWHKYRGTPKGFITLKAGQELWQNRFGNLTAIRFLSSIKSEKIDLLIREKLDPKLVGFYFQPIREKLLLSSKPTTDFGQLFFGLSVFLIFSSCLLAGLVFVFGVQQRREEIGTLLAIGFRSGQIKQLFLSEGLIIAIFGGILGIVLGIGYTKFIIFALSTIWRNAVNSANLFYYAEPLTLLIGFLIGIAISIMTIWLTLRRQFVYTAKELLTLDYSSELTSTLIKSSKRKVWILIAIIAFVISAILVLLAFYNKGRYSSGIFFAIGGFMLIGFFALSNFVLSNLARSKGTERLTINTLSFRNTTRRKGRSLAIISLLACGSFLITSIGA
ncbi:MAG: ABC transporter permease, partial [Candidatus Poribacteria bacterium]